MMKFVWFVFGVIVGSKINVYSRNEFSNKDKVNSKKNYFKEKKTVKERNNQKLSLILIVILVSYAVTALVAIILGMWLHYVIGIVFTVLVIVLGILTTVGVFFIKDNYEDEKGEPEMISFGESLITLGLQLLIGTIAIGAITLFVTLAA